MSIDVLSVLKWQISNILSYLEKEWTLDDEDAKPWVGYPHRYKYN